MKTTVIGLGSMGLGMAKSLLAAGHDVTGCDVNAAAMKAFEDMGGASNGEARAAAEGAEALVIVVLNADQTASVLASGAVEAMAPNGVVISSATMSPAQARAFEAQVAATGRTYLDAPISGGAGKAAEGALTIMASGAPAAFARARPALDAMAATVYELGGAGAGATMKIVNQLLAGTHIAVMGEALAFAAKMGLDLDKVYEVITASAGNSWMFENRAPHVLAGDYSPKSAIDIWVKDLGIVADIGKAEKFPTPMAGAALQLYLMASAAGMGREDDAAVTKLYAQIAGLDLPKGAK
jgi:3-hydroxyisobutyrate dehydrogenase